MALFDFVAQPFSRDFRPDLLANEGSFLVADPPGLAGKDKNRIAGERNQHINVAMNYFETRGVTHGAFKTGVLVAAHDQGVDLFGFHGGADIVVAAGGFFFSWPFWAGLRFNRSAEF